MSIKLSKKRKTVLIIAVIIAILLILFSTNFKTPEIKGVVVDAETGKPITDANIRASWSRTYSGPGGQFGGGTSKEANIITKADGAFVIPSHLLINLVPYPFGQGGSFSMVVYAHGYMNKKFVFYEKRQIENPKYDEFKNKKSEMLTINLREIKDPDTFDKNVLETYTDNEYMLIEYRLFIEKFPTDKRVIGYQLGMGTIYEELEHSEKAIVVYEEIMKEHPNSSEAKIARNRIIKLKG